SYQLVVLYLGENARKMGVNSAPGVTDNALASNLYQNMVREMVAHSIFLNPYIKEEKEKKPEVILNNPTRVINLQDASGQRSIYENFGYSLRTINAEPDGAVHLWSIMDAGFLQATIREFSSHRNVVIREERTESINYDHDNTTRQLANLYMADCICSYLSHNISAEAEKHLREKHPQLMEPEGKKKPLSKEQRKQAAKKAEKERKELCAALLRSRMKELNPRPENMFFYFDDVDHYYEEACKAFLKGYLFEELCQIYSGLRLKDSNPKRYYRKKWFALLEREIERNCSPDMFEKAVDEARAYRVTDNIAQGRLMYVYKKLMQLSNRLEISSEYRLKLYDLGISAYTHIGDPKKAEACYLECRAKFPYAEISQIQEINNRMITVYNDQFRFSEAESMAARVLELKKPALPGTFEQTGWNAYSEMAELVRKMFILFYGAGGLAGNRSVAETESLNEADMKLIDHIDPPSGRKTSYKAWSSLGQVYAFEKDPAAETCFIKVLDVLKKEKGPDYYITLSYLLHWYIAAGNRAEYEKYAKEMFGSDNLSRQLEKILEEGKKPKNPLFTFKYALYVYVKALYYFYSDQTKTGQEGGSTAAAADGGNLQDILRNLKGISSKVKKELRTGHPWEMIHKYMALILLKTGIKIGKASPGKYMMKIRESMIGERSQLIDRIISFGTAEYRKLKSDLDPDNERLYAEYRRSVEKAWEAMTGVPGIPTDNRKTTEEKYEILSETFTYMFR
ncbi:MAG: hypothetical protein IIY77_05915, partial [Lachnospiraceae bacterium]|nr:hypothetical protein [Lachnospiraceae bacterium]